MNGRASVKYHQTTDNAISALNLLSNINPAAFIAELISIGKDLWYNRQVFQL